MDKLTLKKLYNTDFPKIYWTLLRNEKLQENELETILAVGLYFIGLNNTIFQKFGYRLFLLYSIKTGDYKPLYEISLNRGLIPIAQFIEENLGYSKDYGNIQTEINSINNMEFVINYIIKGKSVIYLDYNHEKEIDILKRLRIEQNLENIDFKVSLINDDESLSVFEDCIDFNNN